MKFQRITLPPVASHVNSGVVKRYPLDFVPWIWHPAVPRDADAVLRFTRAFQVDQPTTTRLHLTADQRYELFIDGRRVGMGPDRSELHHWAFATYEVELEAGEHTVEARVWWLGKHKPAAQVTERGGFALTAEGLEDQLDTGEATWQVVREGGWSFDGWDSRSYHVIGPRETFDAGAADDAPVDAGVLDRPHVYQPTDRHTGIIEVAHRLYPSPLPDMLHEPRTVGRVRAVIEGGAAGPVPADACESPAINDWQKMIDGNTPIDIPANTTVHAIVDLQQYYCGFTDFHISQGNGASVTVEWAESLYNVEGEGNERSRHKGDRGEVAGKLWFGFGHTLVGNGDAVRHRSLWWTSGRYHRITVTTADQPLTLHRAGLIETRYPYEDDSHWQSDHGDYEPILPVAVRGIQMCAHETYLDCPYYEQMMYVGDTRLQMLVAHLMTGDDRLTRRGIELFDWSRWNVGFVAERCPSQPFQVCLTFSMIWVYMVRDYMMYRGDKPWVRQRLVGIRNQFENFLPLRNADGLLEALPGWSFVDWVPEWATGYPPDALDGVSSLVNLQFIYSLRCAAEVERWAGEAALADRYTAIADEMGRTVVARFWDAESNRIADDLSHAHFSEHGQSLAILCDILNESQTAAALKSLENDDDLSRTTVYYSFYLLEAFAKLGRGDLIQQRLEFWNTLVELDMKTPVESPEPSRSDCHAWGSHPLYHLHSSLAGIRPASPGFESVTIQPTPGSLREIDSDIPHPRGRIKTKLRFASDKCEATVKLPPNVTGTLIWAGKKHELKSGENTIEA